MTSHLVEDAREITAGILGQGWVDGTLGGVGSTMDGLAVAVDPLGSVASWGVGWLLDHVQPLRTALDELAGDPAEITAHATTWHRVAATTEVARHDYEQRLLTETATWSGATADAYRAHAAEHLTALTGLSTAATGIAAAVEGAGLLISLVRGLVTDLIAAFVATLAARLPQWLAMEGLTLGVATPFVVAQVAALVRTCAGAIRRLVRGLLSSFRRLDAMVDRLKSVLDRLLELVHRITRTPPGGESSPGKPREAAGPSFTPPAAYLTRHGELTNGTYTVSSSAMAKHLPLTAIPGRSVFLSGVDAEKAVLDAAAYADAHDLWVLNKAKVPVVNGPVGVLGGTGELTRYINVYRNDRGGVHGSPGGAS
ncbi:WXG100 family type VII secretion target [Actinoplanes sp. DH11]|uniref:WXG100 family type VII secretion target n=1 Tax=Actinoplanes sp. DH11 TaxID=2857011 RepID=UPI001E5875B4|nr:WXG100 family type VII secretion target [Actinoplanes sp. DH11]